MNSRAQWVRSAAAALALAWLALPAGMSWAADPAPPTYGPLSGANTGQGYQELQVGPDRWFVAYQGNRSTGPDWVEAAWNTRSAQLCKDAGADRFVELRYPFEAVLHGEAVDVNPKPGRAGWRAMPVAGRVYIPTYSYVPSAPIMLDGPSKLGSILCLKSGAELKDAKRGVSVPETLAKAGEMGVNIGAVAGSAANAGSASNVSSKAPAASGATSYSRNARNPPVAP